MYLYQLAWELDQEPPALADRAVALGLGSIDPSDELTAEQESTLRASVGNTGTTRPNPAGASTAGISFTNPGAPQSAPEPQQPGRSSEGRTKKIAIIAASTLAFVGAVAFFATQAAPDEERRSERTEELAAWQDAPLATVPAEVKVAADFPPDQPRDKARLCVAYQTTYDREVDSPEVEDNEQDWTAYRAWAADRTEWQAAIDEMVATGPVNAIPDIRDYQKVREHYWALMTQASDPQLRALYQGVELDELEGYDKKVGNAQRNMVAYLRPICGEPKVTPAG